MCTHTKMCSGQKSLKRPSRLGGTGLTKVEMQIQWGPFGGIRINRGGNADTVGAVWGNRTDRGGNADTMGAVWGEQD